MSDADLEALLNGVSGSLMWAHLEEFARWTKEAGSEDELSSLAYVQRTISGYGFSTELVLHRAYISLPRAARAEIGGDTIRCITHSFSRPSAPDGTTAELVYVGGGMGSDFDRVNVAGKIVLVDGIANPAVSLRASRAGAIGQIHISPHEHTHEMCISPVWGKSNPRDTAESAELSCRHRCADGWRGAQEAARRGR